MKKLSSIEDLKQIIFSGNGTLFCTWRIKSKFFGGYDDVTKNFISGFKELVDETAYIPEIKFDDDYILMNESDFKKKLKKGIHMFTDLDQYNENSRKKILKMIINTKVLSENSSLIKFDVHYEQKKSTLQKLKDYLW